jgi:putative FmdB family regulatory protein
MPTYEYVCAKCDHHFDKFQAISDPPLTVCPRELCGRKPWGKGRVKRVIGAGAGLLFKGSGFYITDYRSEGYRQAAKKETPASKASTTGETKTASTGTSESKGPAKNSAK